MKIRWLAIAFTVFIVLVITLADMGRLRFMFWFISRVPYLDVVLHFFLIGTLTFLVTASFIEAFPAKNTKWIVFANVLFFLIVFTIEEVSQGPIRGRDFSLKDLAANYAGIFTFSFLAWQKFGRKPKALK